MPLSYQMLRKYQNKDKSVKNKVNTSMLKTQYFCGSKNRNIEIATHNGKFYIPKPLHKNVIYWYYIYLMHPSATRAEETTKQPLYCYCIQREVKVTIKNMRLTNCLRREIVILDIYQRNKQKQIHGRKFPLTS